MKLIKKYWVSIFLTLILLISFILMISSARQDSITVDERVHISAGYLHTWLGDYTFNPEHPPLLNDLAGLFAQIAKPKLPNVSLSDYTAEMQWDYAYKFFYETKNNVENITFWSRVPFILLTLGLIYLVFLWSREIFGPKAGLFAAFLAAFEPNILAHGRLATTDIGMTFFFLLTAWLLRKYILKPDLSNALSLGFSLGLVLLSKFSGFLMLPIIFLGVTYVWVHRKMKFKEVLRDFSLIFLAAAVLFYLIYMFSMRGTLNSFGPPAGGFWALAPIEKFLQGYKILEIHNSVGHWNYLNGQINFQGWWYYFPLVLYYKLTIPMLILIVLTMIFLVLGKFRQKNPKNNFMEYSLLISPIILYMVVSLTSHIDIGIRHVLPILPFVIILISGLVTIKNVVFGPIVLGLAILAAVEGLIAYPNYLAYFNQIAGGTKGGASHLIDSNIDWNQNMIRFAKYARKNNITKVYHYCWDPSAFSYYGIDNQFVPTTPVEGVVVICTHQLKIKYDYDISWVEKYPPDDNIDGGMYIWRFDLHPVR